MDDEQTEAPRGPDESPPDTEEQVQEESVPAALRRLASGIGAAVRAASQTDEAQQLKASTKEATQRAKKEIGAKVDEAESSDTGARLKKQAAELLDRTGDALEDVAGRLERGQDEDSETREAGEGP